MAAPTKTCIPQTSLRRLRREGRRPLGSSRLRTSLLQWKVESVTQYSQQLCFLKMGTTTPLLQMCRYKVHMLRLLCNISFVIVSGVGTRNTLPTKLSSQSIGYDCYMMQQDTLYVYNSVMQLVVGSQSFQVTSDCITYGWKAYWNILIASLLLQGTCYTMCLQVTILAYMLILQPIKYSYTYKVHDCIIIQS